MLLVTFLRWNTLQVIFEWRSVDLILPVPRSFFLIFIMQVDLKMETKNMLAFIHEALFILDSLPTLDIWPWKTHGSVIMLSKCFCYESVILNTTSSCVTLSSYPSLCHMWFIWNMSVLQATCNSVTSKYFTSMSLSSLGWGNSFVMTC